LLLLSALLMALLRPSLSPPPLAAIFGPPLGSNRRVARVFRFAMRGKIG
jgi:hypothetical protein